ncbi:hypothetical protein QWY31_03115 [Cytophagales bacterium LB-30]|uniref:DUF3244 domain-containing protein n=1 Tax=Shiella aurantiaca TaxID=3058365 RepID=A0ABT8F1Z9_9BACT|nr:hypothetical protein [Shiella aurantiaca]MDN4164473.1 hypothetical protein [Shiella aurantiaca]
MKFNVSLIALFIALGSVAYANSGSNSLVKVIADENNGIYKVAYRSNEVSRVSVAIYNSNNERVFNETLMMNAFVRPYNLSSMGEGEYTIEISDKNGKTVEKVNYKRARIQSMVQVSKVAKFQGKYLLRITNTANEFVTVRIFNQNEEMIHENSFRVTGDFATVYNLEQVEGNLTFEVEGQNGTNAIIKY